MSPRRLSLRLVLLLAGPALAGCSQTERSAACSLPCGSGLACVQNADFPGGACTTACSLSGGGCPAGDACVPMSTGNYCLQTCSSPDQCPLGFSCSVAGSAGNACVPVALTPLPGGSCAAPQLVTGLQIGPDTQPACRTPVATSTLPAAQVKELGTFDVGTRVPFTLPAGTSAFALVSQAESAASVLDFQGEIVGNAPAPSPLQTPGGGVFFDFTRQNFIVNGNPPPDPTEVLLYDRIFINPAFTGALVFPNTTPGVALALDGGLPSGNWSLVVDDLARLCPLVDGCDAGTSAPGRYRMTLVTRLGAVPDHGTLDFAIYLVTTGGPTATTAPTDAAMVRFASRLAALLAPSGVCVGRITFHDVPTWARNAYASLNVSNSQDPCGDYRQLLTLVAPGSGAMSLYFLDEIVDPGQGGGTTVGYDGAIPGPPTFTGTVAGGAVVSAADLQTGAARCSSTYQPLDCGSDEVATIAAHETGHFLGLYHPTDFQGTTFDPISDTPACVCSACAAAADRASCGSGGSPTTVDQSVCLRGTQLCGGADYLMFWQVSTASKGLLSHDEAAVMRANPQVQ